MLFKPKEEISEIEIKSINQIRALGIDMITEAASGHPGIVLGAAPILYTLYTHHMKINPSDPKWINRDRFVMSAGHGSALLYATLHMAGYEITIDDLKQFRQIDSITPGHPEYGVTKGVDATTGPLGQGVGMAVGMAIAEEYLRKITIDNNEPEINYHTYCLVGDGDLMEGVSYESLSLAGTLNLNKLIIIYDNNNVSLDGSTNLTFTEDIISRMESFGFNVFEVSNGEDIREIDRAIEKAKNSDKPSFISVKTTIGKYSKYEGTNKVHGSPLDSEDIQELKKKLEVRDIPFTISNEVLESIQNEIKERNESIYQEFNEKIQELDDNSIIKRVINNNYKISTKNISIALDENSQKKSLRDASKEIISSVNDPLFIGGSCDLFSSCRNYQEEQGDFSSKNRSGRNIWFGVREHASGAIINGMCLSGIRAYTSTFLSFSDYLKPSIRLAALMNLPTIYIFTHDSITVGEDGPTHQPIEQLDSLRIIPNVEVYRPADSNEVIGTYKTILEKNEGVSIIVLSRNTLDLLSTTSVNDVKNGAYIVSDVDKKLDGIIISSGEDLHTVLDIKKRLLTKGIDIRIVSMVSTNRFDKKDDEYKNIILPKNIRKMAIESSTALSYLKYVKEENLININTFGYSGKKEDIISKLELKLENIEDKLFNK